VTGVADVAKKAGPGVGRVCRWALGYALRRKRGLTAVAGLTLLRIGLDVLKPWPMKVLVDHVLEGEPLSPGLTWLGALPGAGVREGLLAWCVAGTAVLFLLAWLLGLALALANVEFAQRLTFDVAEDLLRRLLRLPPRFHARRPVGDTVRQVTSGCAGVAGILKDALLPVPFALVSLVLMAVILCRLDPLLTLLALAVVPGMVLVFRRYARPMMERSYRQQEVEGGLYNVVEQTLSAVPVVQAFGQEEQADRRFAASTEATLGAALATTDVQLKFKVLIGLLTAAGTAAVLWVGASHALDGTLSVGGILVFLTYLASLYAPLETLTYTSTTLQDAAGKARGVLEVLETQPDVADRPAAVPLPPARGHVRLDGVTFGYEAGRPVLRDVSLEVEPGQTVALVGSSGAGKTTMAGLIWRVFDPWQGRVLVDGHDVRDVTVVGLRRQVAVVAQDAFLFPRTVAENVAYGRPGATREQVEAAARAANAHGFIERLPKGYDTVIGERGATLSGGERQRLSIARAFLKDAPVLILDEPTSALDAATEAQLLEALERLRRGRTTLVIAHRLSTVRGADRILVLEAGRLVEAGTHEELLARGDRYGQLHRIQFGPPG
jgi:ATP-binding cassette subfamily B protein/subfamily B ATP-binding cassette protein MsbA